MDTENPAPAKEPEGQPPPPPEPKVFCSSPETMPAILRASRGGLSKERWERVRKRCQANRPNLPDYQDRTAPRPLGDD